MKTIRVFSVLQCGVATASAIACLFLLPVPAEGQLAFTNLQSFSVLPNGSDPMAGLVQGSDGSLYGTASGGGANGGSGTVFKVTTNGIATLLHAFSGGADGGNPRAGLALGNDGEYYGTTYFGGGRGSAGTVFKITTNGSLTTLHSFGSGSGSDGAFPEAGLVLGSDGNFYGTTYNGGTSGGGTVFKITTNGVVTILFSFVNDNRGANPTAGLVQGGDGSLYGTTYVGGTNSAGTVFKIMTNGTLTSLYSFKNGVDGAFPAAGLLLGSDGNLYGTTESAGSNGFGTVFKITTNGTLTSLHSFTGADGANPAAALVQGANGVLRGTTRSGGNNGNGTVFKITTGGTLTSLYSFTGGADGAAPAAALVQGSDVNFYGTAAGGGSGNGTIFKFDTNQTFSVVFAFPLENNIEFPSALVHGSDGNFYGTSQSGGTNGGNGTVFQMTTNGALTILYSFTGGDDGADPAAALVQGSDGLFYGTTQFGSAYGNGTVFNISSNGDLTTLHPFTGGNDGGSPVSALVQGGNGNFYGATSSFNLGFGTIFEVSPAGDLTTLYTFTNNIDGSGTGVLNLGDDGNFYGTTPDGGTNFAGAFFVMGPDGNLTVLYSFTGGDDGGNPFAPLALAGDGNFYGSTSEGGFYDAGTVFQVTPGGSLTTLYSFEGYFDGSSPSQLLAGTDGKFYGTTPGGGINFEGSVFEMTFDGALSPLYEFTGGDDGGNPYGSLVQDGAGNLYGITAFGAGGGNGGVFRLSGSGLPSPLPVITAQPASPPPILTGLSTEFAVNALGGTPLFYQWRLNGVPLSADDDFYGLNLATLSVDAASPGDAGTYSVVVSNSYGVTTSSNAVLTLLADTNAMEDFEAGTNYLAVGDYALANLSFSTALGISPTNADYNFFFAATGLLSLPQEPAGSNFLSRIGFGSAGRNLFNWLATASTNAEGHLEIPVATPPLNADEFTAQLRTNVLPALVVSESSLGQIVNTNFTVDLTTNETHAAAVTVDWGDVQMLQAMGNAEELFIYTTYSWNLNVQLAAATNYFGEDGTIQDFLTNYPSLLTTTTTADLPAAKAAFTSAINEYFIASQFIRSRPPGEIRLFNLDASKMQEELQFRQTLSNLLASLNGPVPLTVAPAYSVSAQALFGGNFSPRSYLPEFQGDEFVWDTFPDTTFGGIITGLTEKQIGQRVIRKHLQTVLDLPGASLTVLYDFTNFSGQTGVVQGPDGNLYGTLNIGGPYVDEDPYGLGYGSIFKVTTNGQFSTLYNFGTRQDPLGNPLDGSYPNALVAGSDGNLYGTTESGGNGGGAFFRVTLAGQFTNLYDFGSVTDQLAFAPIAALVQGSDHRFYGTAAFGGTNGAGIVFAVSTNGAFTVLNSFTNLVIPTLKGKGEEAIYYPDGATPSAPLIQGNDGNFYGVTSFGGIVGTNYFTNITQTATNIFTNFTEGFGTIFKLTPAGQLSVIHTFNSQQDEFGNPLDGAMPNGLVQAADGTFYGTTGFGGANDDEIGFNGFFGFFPGSGDGTLFSFSPAIPGSFATLLSFDENFADGYYPIGSLVANPGGTLCGVTAGGGANNKGAIFIFNTNGIATNIVWFDTPSGGYDGNIQSFGYFASLVTGSSPGSALSLLTPGSNGIFYGTTTEKGTNGDGTIYELNLNGVTGAPPAPVIQSVALTGGRIGFSWSTSSGSSYQVQYKTNLNQNTWANLGGATNATGTSQSATDSITGAQRFYRIELVQ